MIVYGVDSQTHRERDEWIMRPHVRSLYAKTPEEVRAHDMYNHNNYMFHVGCVGIHTNDTAGFYVARFELTRAPISSPTKQTLCYAPILATAWTPLRISDWLIGQWNRCAIAREPEASTRIQNLWHESKILCNGFRVPAVNELSSRAPFVPRALILERVT